MNWRQYYWRLILKAKDSALHFADWKWRTFCVGVLAFIIGSSIHVYRNGPQAATDPISEYISYGLLGLAASLILIFAVALTIAPYQLHADDEAAHVKSKQTLIDKFETDASEALAKVAALVQERDGLLAVLDVRQAQVDARESAWSLLNEGKSLQREVPKSEVPRWTDQHHDWIARTARLVEDVVSRVDADRIRTAQFTMEWKHLGPCSGANADGLYILKVQLEMLKQLFQL